MDGLIAARVLVTIATIGYGLVTVKADFNKTHATNPLWTGHARFHVVWQIASYVGFGIIALALIWMPGELSIERLYLASAFAGVVYGAFFISLLCMSVYGGRAYDDNGYLPLKIRNMKWDVNVLAFSIMTVLLAAGVALIAAG